MEKTLWNEKKEEQLSPQMAKPKILWKFVGSSRPKLYDKLFCSSAVGL